jgi:hypothetical protein
MKAITIAGVLLAVLGVLALIYQGFNYTREKNVVDVGPIHATLDTEDRVSIPPIVGGLTLAAGVALLVVGARKKS